MKKYIPPILSGLAVALGGGVLVAHAQGYTPLAPLQGLDTATVEPKNLISTYLSGMLKLLVALGGGLAVLVAIIGGTQYVAAGISPSAKEDAKGRITNAFIGLTLILTSYLILYSINPKLAQFSLMLPSVSPQTTTPTVVPPTGSCPVADTTPLSGLALSMEGGTNVIWQAGAEAADPTLTNTNLTKTKAEVDKLIAALSSVSVSAVVTSAYRPYDYQKHLYEVNNKWNGLNGERRLRDMDVSSTANSTSTTYPECASLKDKIGAEHIKHFGATGAGQVVDNPLGNAPHTIGTGVDIKLTGMEYTAIDAFMTSKGIKLDWQGLPTDVVHFNYNATGPKP